jgi:hypothetical protein
MDDPNNKRIRKKRTFGDDFLEEKESPNLRSINALKSKSTGLQQIPMLMEGGDQFGMIQNMTMENTTNKRPKRATSKYLNSEDPDADFEPDFADELSSSRLDQSPNMKKSRSRTQSNPRQQVFVYFFEKCIAIFCIFSLSF